MISLPLFTRAALGGRTLFRSLRLELRCAPGEGRVWMDLSRGRVADDWQSALHDLVQVGRRRFPQLGWEQHDLFIHCRGRGAQLEGRSASLPLFVAFCSLLSGRPLPAPFFAAGVAPEGSESLCPAPFALVQGKLAVADQLAGQLSPGARTGFHLPSGSDYRIDVLGALTVCEHPTLSQAAASLLGLVPCAEAGGHPAAPAGDEASP